MNDHRKLIRVGGVIDDAIRNGRRDQRAMAILVLETLAGERRAARGGPEEKAASLNVSRRPDEIADALETEHRIENVERHHVDAVIAVGGSRGNP